MLSYDPKHSYSIQKVTGCYFTKVYYVYYLRNAYYGTVIERYSGDWAFHKTLNDAKQHAETGRIRGSHFCIDEIPALVFPISNFSLLVTEINTVDPFKHFLSGLPASKQASCVADYFAPHSHIMTKRFYVWDGVAVPFLPFRCFSSKAVGTHKSLSWIEHDSSLNLQYARAVANRLTRWIHRRKEKQRLA